MTEKGWIGIQFNWVTKVELKNSLVKFKSLGIESNDDHIFINFSNNELKRISNGIFDEDKISIIQSIIKKYLQYSDYTNIYTYINAEKLSKIKNDLIENVFKGERIRTELMYDKNKFFANFDSSIVSNQIINVVDKNPLIIFFDKLFGLVAKRDFAVDQKITLEIGFEDAEEWGTDTDNLNVSIQFDK